MVIHCGGGWGGWGLALEASAWNKLLKCPERFGLLMQWKQKQSKPDDVPSIQCMLNSKELFSREFPLWLSGNEPN